MEDTAPESADTSTRPRTLILWRLLSLFYDFWPCAAMWMLVSLLFNLGYTVLGHHPERENIPPGSLLSWLLFLACVGVTGLYATGSWRRGGQTLGMRPWRLKVVATDGGVPGWGALWLRYLVGVLSLLAGGLGFWWAWFDRGRLAWHDRASGTRVVRLPKRR
jgi:Predicted membrane protein/domain